MGWRYLRFRSWYEVKRKTGLLKRSYPVDPPVRSYISLAEWRQNAPTFFFPDRSEVSVPRYPNETLEREARAIIDKGEVLFFNSTRFTLPDYNWTSNPQSKYQYDTRAHWTEIEDFTADAGDIKFVWEKSRFSYLYPVLRYDHHFEQDCAEFVLGEILSWCEHNPVNRGPNYKCSQEISLRVLNWTFALYYYRNSPALTEDRFKTILHHIYWQMHHVYENINFSRICVRNNHAISETLGLYLTGILFPFFPGADRRRRDGKRWFEQEILFQVTPDGTFLQYSMNYHRIVVQLMTWAFSLGEQNGDQFPAPVYERAAASLRFLYHCMNIPDGVLPNYGANDGALFFKLNDADYRDYRPQLNALARCLYGRLIVKETSSAQEDALWYNHVSNYSPVMPFPKQESTATYDTDGYYLIRDAGSFTFLRCGRHRTRPSQADNLHLDLWVDGENLLRDAGSYKYNTDLETTLFFKGTTSHNTVMLGGNHQMEKGPRFIWYEWSQALQATLQEKSNAYVFEGSIKAFTYLDPEIHHHRQVVKQRGAHHWTITDRIEHKPDLPMQQLWNPTERFFERFVLRAVDANGKELQAEERPGWYSGRYGERTAARQWVFTTDTDTITTTIEPK